MKKTDRWTQTKQNTVKLESPLSEQRENFDQTNNRET